jgi:FPC/CPF motif-containing protein YcgG
MHTAHTHSVSHYLAPSAGTWAYRSQPQDLLSARDAAAHEVIRSHVLAADYPCVMARSAFNRDTYRLSTYGALGSSDNAQMLCHDLYTFCAEFPQPVDGAASFVACFEPPAPQDETEFEKRLWQQLQAIHDVDQTMFEWCADVESDPESTEFSFSVGGRAFFLVGMHPAASRIARRTPMPVIVFNLHEQFVALRANGKFDGVRDKIQRRDQKLQGSINPMAADHGDRSEAAQYSGRRVSPDWACPFSPK